MEPRAVMEAAGPDVSGSDLYFKCLSAPLRDGDVAAPGLQPECLVEERVPRGDAPGVVESYLLPACDPVECDPAGGADCECAQHPLRPGAPGCWYVWRDADTCPPFGATDPRTSSRVWSGLRFKVDRGLDSSCQSPAAPPGSVTVVQCGTRAANPAAGLFDCSPGCADHWPACCPTSTPGCWP